MRQLLARKTRRRRVPDGADGPSWSGVFALVGVHGGEEAFEVAQVLQARGRYALALRQDDLLGDH